MLRGGCENGHISRFELSDLRRRHIAPRRRDDNLVSILWFCTLRRRGSGSHHNRIQEQGIEGRCGRIHPTLVGAWAEGERPQEGREDQRGLPNLPAVLED